MNVKEFLAYSKAKKAAMQAKQKKEQEILASEKKDLCKSKRNVVKDNKK